MGGRSARWGYSKSILARTLRRAENSGVIPDRPASLFSISPATGWFRAAVESSNVDPVREMARLIEVTRAFDRVAAEAAQSEGSLQDAIKALRSTS